MCFRRDTNDNLRTYYYAHRLDNYRLLYVEIPGFFMLRFLIKVLKNPYKKEEEKSEA